MSAFDVPGLNLPQATGIALLIRYLTYNFSGNSPEKKEFIIFIAKAVFVSLFTSALILLIGWIITLLL